VVGQTKPSPAREEGATIDGLPNAMPLANPGPGAPGSPFCPIREIPGEPGEPCGDTIQQTQLNSVTCWLKHWLQTDQSEREINKYHSLRSMEHIL
jgi:hypothetical protein